MHRIDIPGGGWVELRDPAEMTMRHKKVIRSAGLAALAALKKAESKLPKDLPTDLKERLAIVSKLDMTELGLNFDEAESFQTMQAASIVAYVSAWSFKEPVPTMDTVWDMDEERYDFLASATADLSNATAEVDFDPNPGEEPGNPTGRLNTSNGRSSVKPAKVLMPRSSRTTKSISSVT
jgi:hypothetical protein